MSGIRTAETRNIRENAEAVLEKVVCPALEQQKPIIWWKMLKKCRRRYHLRHYAGEGSISGIRTAETRKNGENAEAVPEKVVSPALEQQNQKNSSPPTTHPAQ